MCADKPERRRKGKNFTNGEILLFIELLKKYVDVLENKKTDGANQKKKTEAWNALTEDYNSYQEYESRTSTQLKSFYDNYKRKIKKEYAEDKAEEYKTGGGYFKRKLDATGETLLALLEQFKPDETAFDSTSAKYYDVHDPLMESEMYIKDEDTYFENSEASYQSGADNGNKYFEESTTLDKQNVPTTTSRNTFHTTTSNIKNKRNPIDSEAPEAKRTTGNNLEVLTTENTSKENYKNECLKLKMEYKKHKLLRIIQINEEERELFTLQKKKLENEIKLQEIEIKSEELKLKALETNLFK